MSSIYVHIQKYESFKSPIYNLNTILIRSVSFMICDVYPYFFENCRVFDNNIQIIASNKDEHDAYLLLDPSMHTQRAEMVWPRLLEGVRL